MPLKLTGMKVAQVIAPKDFRDEEFSHPHAALKIADADVTVVSTEKGPHTGMLGAVVHAQMSLADALNKDWDAVVFVGGGGSAVYIDDEQAHALARKVAEAGKPVCAICMAPSILAHAGLLDGVEATAWKDQKEDLISHGALWSDAPVATSKNTINEAPIVTANGPKAAMAFGSEVVSALRGPIDPFAFV